jgi:hypothetical protein
MFRLSRRCKYASMIVVLIAVIFVSCKKEDKDVSPALYGKWKSNFGDTVLFTSLNGKHILVYDSTPQPGLPVEGDVEYVFSKDGKLALNKDVISNGKFRKLETFTWTAYGKEFEVKAFEWFQFISSTLTVFTFTKIQ